MLKRILKRNLQYLLSHTVRQHWITPTRQLVVLMYHRILPDSYPELDIVQPGMSVTPETFRMHLKVLKQLYEIVRLDDWLTRFRTGKQIPTKACAITFDDGWRDNFNYAYPILQSEQVPATIFLVTDLIGTKNSFWPERLARLLWKNGKGLPASIWKEAEFNWLQIPGASYTFAGDVPCREEIDELIGMAKRYPDTELEERLTRMEARAGMSDRPDNTDLLDWEQIKSMKISGLLDYGSHTRHHRRITESMDKETMRDEILGSKKIIEAKAGFSGSTFCYPNGDVTDEALQVVQDNYIGACTTINGWNTRSCDPYMLKRIGIHQDIAWDKTAFMSRLSGWL